ncbi:MAG: DsbA family protein [Candidatus Micrarchaeia archaeon]
MEKKKKEEKVVKETTSYFEIISSPRIFIPFLIILLLCSLAFFVYQKFYAGKPTDMHGNNQTMEGGPVHKDYEVVRALDHYLWLYYGITPHAHSESVYESGKWHINVSFYSAGKERGIIVELYDENLSVYGMYAPVPLLTIPSGVVQLEKVECNESEKLRIIEFSDPYCIYCIESQERIKPIIMKYNASFEYYVAYTSSLNLMKSFDASRVELASKYVLCSQKQNKIHEFLDCVGERYMNHTGIPLSEAELIQCSVKTGLNITKMDECLPRIDEELRFGNKLAETYMQQITTPAILVNCKYLASPSTIENAICWAYPNITQCRW